MFALIINTMIKFIDFQYRISMSNRTCVQSLQIIVQYSIERSAAAILAGVHNFIFISSNYSFTEIDGTIDNLP